MKQKNYLVYGSFAFNAILICFNSFAQADVIITNGKIFTSDSRKLYVQALAIKGDKIIASGTNEEIEKLTGSSTKRINVNSKTVVPGFNDAHDHPGFTGIVGHTFNASPGIDFSGLTKQASIDSVARILQVSKQGEWIHGFIGNTVFKDTSMRATLDSLAPNNPVELQVWWGHGMVVNKKALEASGYTDSARDPAGGWFIRNTSGKISSLQENAQAKVWVALNEANKESFVKNLQSYVRDQLTSGITSVQYMGTGLTQKLVTSLFPKLISPQRMRIIRWYQGNSSGIQKNDWNTTDTKISPLVTISGVKYTIDGTSEEGNALHKKRSLKFGEQNGRLNYAIDSIRQIIRESLLTNRQLMLHITADSSFELVLDLIQQTASAKQFASKRIRVEHNCVGPISDHQKSLLRNYNILMMHTPKYGQKSPLRSLWDKGVFIGISPDGTTNPFLDIMICTSLQDDPLENLTREQAVIAYTKNNAYAEFAENEKGTLMPGMVADLTVLTQDIFTIPVQQLPATKSELTIIGGKIVYEQQ